MSHPTYPPAPFSGPTKEQVIKSLSRDDIQEKLPITLGTGAPKAVIMISDGKWLLRELTINPTKIDRLYKQGQKDGYFMPEHVNGALEPGNIIIQSHSQKEFIEAIASLDWTF